MKRFLAAILAAAAAFSFAQKTAALESAPAVSARAWVVMESQTGRILAGQNEDKPMLIASTTKILTALVVLEHMNPDELVTIAPEWTGIEGSSIYLQPGERCSVRTLLYGMLLQSGNDAATALACGAAGSVEAFAALMNEKAAALGCGHSHFVNACGLDAEGHFSCARDLAIIMREALKNKEFCAIVSSVSKTVGGRTFYNHNRLLSECPGVFGGKTGYTLAAGRSLVSCCEREGMTLICVTLCDPNDWADHAELYDWAYGLYTAQNILPENAGAELPLLGGCSDTVRAVPEGSFCLPREKTARTEVCYELPRFVYAGVYAGQTAGRAVIYVDGKQAGTCRMVWEENAPRDPAAALDFGEKLLRFFRIAGRNVYSLS